MKGKIIQGIIKLCRGGQLAARLVPNRLPIPEVVVQGINSKVDFNVQLLFSIPSLSLYDRAGKMKFLGHNMVKYLH